MIRRQPRDGGVAVTFVLPADHPNAPISVVGTFNDWQPHRHPMRRWPDGSLRTTVMTHAGATLRFRYLGAHGVWFDDPDADRIDAEGGLLLL